MTPAILLAAALAATTADYHINLTRYFASPSAELAERAMLERRIGAFAARPARSLSSPHALHAWLAEDDALLRAIARHETYAYLRAEIDRDDRDAAAADEAMDTLTHTLDAAVQRALVAVGQQRVERTIAQDAALKPYRYLIQTVYARSRVDTGADKAARLLADPALASLSTAYQALRRQALSTRAPSPADASAQQKYVAKFQPYLDNETAFAALLIPTITLRDGAARLQSFASRPDQAYFDNRLTRQEVDTTLAALQGADAYQRYQDTLAAVAAKRLHIGIDAAKPWDEGTADTYHPASVAFEDAIPQILAAEQAMGRDYAGHFESLFAPQNQRVEWCRSAQCDDAGFSVGSAGLDSGLFYGAYTGTTDNMRTTAHEAAHAVHRQFMSENQPIAAYNEGPHFVFESIAIFNELLFLDHLYRTAPTREGQAYFLHQFVADAVDRTFGSAKSTDLEQSIYDGVRKGSVRTAADLDALSLQVFARYMPAAAMTPERKVTWAMSRLYYTDPMYSVNYLFAGLLALNYLQQFEQDPQGFSQRYVAMLKQGFPDVPQVLLRQQLGIDVDDAAGLVQRANVVINQRTDLLAKCYTD